MVICINQYYQCSDAGTIVDEIVSAGKLAHVLRLQEVNVKEHEIYVH